MESFIPAQKGYDYTANKATWNLRYFAWDSNIFKNAQSIAEDVFSDTNLAVVLVKTKRTRSWSTVYQLK
jgi:hypothetical protein